MASGLGGGSIRCEAPLLDLVEAVVHDRPHGMPPGAEVEGSRVGTGQDRSGVGSERRDCVGRSAGKNRTGLWCKLQGQLKKHIPS
jgi:hypothetical protein